MAWKLVPDLFLIFIESFAEKNPRLEVVLNSLQLQEGLELVFRSQFLWIFSYYLFFCNMISTDQISLTGRVYFPKLFSKMYFLFYASAFNDDMKLEYLKF